MPRLKPDLPEHCLQLPPCLELGELLVDAATGKWFAQPSIEYSLRPLVILDNREEDGNKTIETALPVIIAPYTDEFPPTETKDFPAEFKEQDSKVLRRHLMTGDLGELTVSIREPSALRYEVQALQARTSASAKLEFKSQSSSQMYQTLQRLSSLFSLWFGPRHFTLYRRSRDFQVKVCWAFTVPQECATKWSSLRRGLSEMFHGDTSTSWTTR